MSICVYVGVNKYSMILFSVLLCYEYDIYGYAYMRIYNRIMFSVSCMSMIYMRICGYYADMQAYITGYLLSCFLFYKYGIICEYADLYNMIFIILHIVMVLCGYADIIRVVCSILLLYAYDNAEQTHNADS